MRAGMLSRVQRQQVLPDMAAHSQNSTAGATAAPGATGTREGYRTADLEAASPYRGGPATGGAATGGVAATAAPADTPEANSVYGGSRWGSDGH